MFQEISLFSSPLIDIRFLANILKGGDFMGLEDEVSRMIWEGSPVSNVVDPKPKNSQFPERKGRIKPEVPTVLEIAAREPEADQAFTLNRVLDIDWGA